ncbi:HAMP domain-containing sensor histidine kinase [Isosphaeraceae bacterium EP7]
MSYRSFKHLLGETSLERKCRYIFAGGIFFLVTFSFWWYGQKTEGLVIGQTTQAARRLVDQVLMMDHYKRNFSDVYNLPVISGMFDGIKGRDDLPNFEQHILSAYPIGKKAEEQKKLDAYERESLAIFLAAANTKTPPGVTRKPFSFPDNTPMERWQINEQKKQFQYVQAIQFRSGCFSGGCHGSREKADGKYELVKEDELAGAVVVGLPMDQTRKAIHQNRAFLITSALVTALIAMYGSATIVRYVIVKPLKHLRDVSDAIAAGKLNIRAHIQTGDDFEELSHAFNRMLHNLVAMQQELRQVNGDLDKKVDELAQANLALFEMNRLKSDFLATMSHELRTPLNSIIGFSEVLTGSDHLPERQKRYATNIQSSGKMLLGMINDILDLAKIESGKMEVRTEDFSIRDVCEALTSLMRPTAEKKEIDLECRLDEAIPLLRQDPGKIRQIIYNLLSNAVKFTPEGGKVTMKVAVEGRSVVLSVADTGIGIAEEDREKIFEKFRQVSGPDGPSSILTREHQGTGLGLSIVRELARLLGGDVHLESRLGHGSIFTVRIPLQLPGNRRFEVNVSDERIDLSKARRIEPRVPTLPVLQASHVPTGVVGPVPPPPRRSLLDPFSLRPKS